MVLSTAWDEVGSRVMLRPERVEGKVGSVGEVVQRNIFCFLLFLVVVDVDVDGCWWKGGRNSWGNSLVSIAGIVVVVVVVGSEVV